MKLLNLHALTALGLIAQVAAAAAANIRAIYLFKDVMKSNTSALKTSGFNSVIMFGIGITADGGIMYYSNTAGSKDVLVASNGSYTGGAALAEKVRSLKDADSGINRLEVSMNAQHVRDLMRSPGPAATSPLYRSWAALKEAWALDAVNNDDESIYDTASTVAFAKMLGAVGLKYTIAPYTNSNFWIAVKNQLNGGANATDDALLDRVYLQCYDGGASNNPAGWSNALGMKVVPLVWVTNDSKPGQGNTVAQAKSKFASYAGRGGLAGGGYWNDYDIEKMKLSYKAYGDVLLSAFP
jgi:hypothetical protein